MKSLNKHFTYILILLATITNAYFSVFARLNKEYHWIEVAMLLCYVPISYLVYKVKDFWQWIIIAVLVRFSLYSAIYGYVAYKDVSYLGDKALTDRFLNWLLYDVMNQGTDAIVWLYIVALGISIMMYLNLVLKKQ